MTYYGYQVNTELETVKSECSIKHSFQPCEKVRLLPTLIRYRNNSTIDNCMCVYRKI